MRRLVVICLAVVGLAGVLAGCGAQGVVTPTPETVVGSLPKATPDPLTPAFALKGDPVAGKKIFQSSGCGELPHARRRRGDRHDRPEPRREEAELPAGHRARHPREVADAVVQGPADRAADRRRRVVRRHGDRRHSVAPVELPDDFPREVKAFASDLDRTLVAADALLRPRTAAAIAAVRATGVHVIVVTGRMFRSVRPYVLAGRARRSGDLLPGRRRRRSGDRRVPPPRPGAAAVALEAIDAVVAAGFHVNCYVDDELYVAEVTPEARSYADFQNLEIHRVGDLHAWLKADPTKLVAVGDPAALDELEAELKPRFAGRLYISKSLPYFLEFAHPDVSKGAGLQFVADRLGFTPAQTVACGDGENDKELLDWAGFGVAVANAHPDILRRADLVVPPVEEEGVAALLEAYLDSRS